MPPGVPVAVVTVKVEVTAVVPLIETVPGLKEQVGAGVPPVILLQEGVMLPVYPLAGVKVMVDVAVLPAVTVAGFSALAVSE